MKSKLFVLLCLTLACASDNSSVQALNSYEQRYDALMNNVVNANTPGFKASQVTAVQEKGEIVTIIDPSINKPGPLIYSGDPFYVGLEGPGFFVVKGPAEDYYTRDGRFHLTLDNQLVTLAGNYPVYGVGGLIQLQPGQNGQLQLVISNSGQIILNGALVDGLLIIGVEDITQLEPVNGAFFRKRGNTNQSNQSGVLNGESGAQDFLPIEKPAVRQYYYEGSNVDIAEEMVSMPGISKKFDANSKALQIMKKMRTTGREMGSPQ
jgi:flagellar basal body rod protein FlgG